MTRLRKTRIAASLFVIALAGLVWYLSTRIDGSSRRTLAAQNGSLHRAKAADDASPRAFARAQLNEFRALRGKARPLPPFLRASITSTRSQEINSLWLEHTAYVGTSAGGLWVVDGKGVTCIVQATRGDISCVDTAIFLRKGLILGIFNAPKHPTEPPSDFFAWGVAPDWAKKARLRVGDTTQAVPVQNNGYALHAHAPIFLDRLEP